MPSPFFSSYLLPKTPEAPPRLAFLADGIEVPTLLTSYEEAIRILGQEWADATVRTPFLEGQGDNGIWALPHPDRTPRKPTEERLPVLRSCSDCKHSRPLISTKDEAGRPQNACMHEKMIPGPVEPRYVNVYGTEAPPTWCPMR